MDRLKLSTILEDEHTKSIYSPNSPKTFPEMQKAFPSVLPERVYQVPTRMYSESSQKKPAKH